MSDPPIPWWLERKELSLARKARAALRPASAEPGDAFLIVTEGKVTEPVYFTLLRNCLQLGMVRVKITPGDASDPRHVIKTAARLAKGQPRRARGGKLGMNEPARFDHVWAVIDTDVAVRNGIWPVVLQLAAARRVRLAHSTPCFEFWLLLHIAGYTTRSDLPNGDAAKAAVKLALGRDYSTNEETAKAVIPIFLPKWPEAVVHAQRVRTHHETGRTPPPGNPSTEVDRLACALNDSAPVHLRKIPCAYP